MTLPIPGQSEPVPDPTEPIQAAQSGPGDYPRPVASVPKPAGNSETIEDRLTALEKDVNDLKAFGSESVVTLTQKLDDAGLLREQPAKAAASGDDLAEK